MVFAVTLGEACIVLAASALALGAQQREYLPERAARFRPLTTTLCSGLAPADPDATQTDWRLVSDRHVLVYSALYDNEHGDFPFVRVIAAGLQEKFNHMQDMHCVMWFEGKDEPIATGPVVYEVIYPSLGHGDMWTAHFIKCQLPPSDEKLGSLGIPRLISITPQPCQPNPANQMEVFPNVFPPQTKTGFGVCYPALYNSFRNYKQLIEMFEVHRILGANLIIIYVYSASNEILRVLHQYQEHSSEDFAVQMLNWKIPDQRLKTSVHVQRASLNDCYYRMSNMGLKYVAVHDLDEILVPRAVHTWPQLLQRVDRDSCPCFSFQHYYYRRNRTLMQDLGEDLITQTSFFRTDQVDPPGKIRCKTMYKAGEGLSLDLHFPYQTRSGAECCMLDPEVAALHHYRSTPMESFVKHPSRYRYVEDKYMRWMYKRLKPSFESLCADIQQDSDSDEKSYHTHGEL